MNNVSGQTIARTIVLFLAFLNQILAVSGKVPLDIAENDIYQVVSLVVTIGSGVLAWWKNNDFTPAAKKGTAVTRALKKGKEVQIIKSDDADQEFTQMGDE